MLKYVEKKYFPGKGEYFKPSEAEQAWLTYFVDNYLGGTDLLGRHTQAQFDWRFTFYHFGKTVPCVQHNIVSLSVS